MSREEFLSQIKHNLSRRKIGELLKLFEDEDNAEKIRENPWDIIPCVTTQISMMEEDNYVMIDCCEVLLEIIGKLCEPDDVLLILIKDLEHTLDDTRVLCVLTPLQKAVLSLLPRNRINYLAWCFNSIQTYVNKLPTPANLNLEGREKLLMDFDKATARITKVYEDLLPFYNPIIEEIEKLQLVNYKTLTEKYLIQLLGKPLAFLDMDCPELKSKARAIAENLMFTISNLSSDVYQILDENYNESEDISIKKLAGGVFLYLLLSERVCLDKAPKLYDPVYVFQNGLKFVVNMFTFDNQFVIEKGLKLATALLEITTDLHLSYELLDSNIHCKFCESISNILIYSPVGTYRKTSLKIFHSYLHRFDTRGRYLLIYNITRTINHSALIAYIVTQYKEMMVEQLDKNATVSEYFTGTKLATLLKLFCKLPEGAESDLMKTADQIIASINLLRYLVIRDKQNETKIWDHLKWLEPSYLEALKNGLMLSRAHYNLSVEEVTTEKAHGDKNRSDSEVSVTIDGKNLPELSSVEKLRVLKASITAFDVIESLLCRLNECIEAERKIS